MNELKPLSQCSVFLKEETMEQAGPLQRVIIKEEVDLEPDYIEFNTQKDTDAQMDHCEIKVEIEDDKQTDPLGISTVDIENVKPSDEMSKHYNDYSQIHQDIVKTEIKLEIDTNDEASGSELSKLHESEADTLHISDIYNESPPSARSLKQHTTEKNASPTKPNTTHKQQAIGTISCSKCAFRCVKQSTLTRHKMKSHAGKVYSCDLCSYKCERKKYLIKHISTHTNNKELFSCHNCDYKSTSRAKLLRHLKSLHPTKVHDDGNLFSCNMCAYKCKRNYSLIEHKRKHTGELFSCDNCEYRTTRKVRIISHVGIHTREKNYWCRTCKYRSTCQDNFRQHMKTHEQANSKRWACDVCCSSFRHKKHLNSHMKIHTGEKPHSCSVCDYKCSSKYSLNVHMRRHTGEKPYLCNICYSKYTHRSSLNKHLKKHIE